jgi:NAD(P)-dependent dehydrogenase (short-subunit alcohol dehydrogenase family)
MLELGGRTAVVTGGASGIGRAMAEAFAGERMRVVLADVEAEALERAAGELRAGGATVLAVPTDVSSADQVQALADRAVAEYGRVDVVCNNAGVALSGPSWRYTLADWEWLLGVNLWGVVHGIRTFVPLMLRQGGEGHVVNTGSIAGLTSMPFMGAYNASKHAVVTLSETLHKELGAMDAPVKVSVLCPGFVNTRILESERNRPASLRNPMPAGRNPSFEDMARTALAVGLDPAAAAAQVVDAIRRERFWVLTHPEYGKHVRERMEDILEGRNPSPVQSAG